MNEKLIKIQNELSVPKNRYNKFGEYNYRSCEDILDAVKPLLQREGLLMTITDEIVNVGDRNYVKATVTLTSKDNITVTDEILNIITTSAYAREAVTPKAKTDDSQLTGATSSYARKYALNGLFLIDDVQDSDSTNDHSEKVVPQFAVSPSKPLSTEKGSDVPNCPKCGGEMWDNRQGKTNPKAPDFKCKDSNCKDEKGYVTATWEQKPATKTMAYPPKEQAVTAEDEPPFDDEFLKNIG
jgi:hypothetical protein